MFKKYWLILLAFMLAFGLMMTGCDNGNGDDPVDPVIEYCEYCEDALPHNCSCPKCLEDYLDCECVYLYTVLTVVQEGASLPSGIPEVPAGERAQGKGYIVGKQFERIKNAPFGSIVELDLSGTGNLDWGTIGGVGHGDMDTDFEVTFAPPATAGEYTREVLAEDIYRLYGFGNAAAVFVNAWGGHNIERVLFGKIKEPDTDVRTPERRDFHIQANLLQFVADGPIVAVTVAPHFRMSSGAITIKYDANTTVPSAPGWFPVTFDVAAATGYSATTLTVGNLDIRAARPAKNQLGAILSISSGMTVAGFDPTLVLVDDANVAGTVPFSANGGAPAPKWVLNEDETFSLRISGAFNWHGIVLTLPFAAGDRITVTGRFGTDTVGDGSIVANANTGGWADVCARWGVGAGNSFTMSGTFNATQAAFGVIRLESNQMTAGHIFIDSILIER